jgi:hypothetical protein
MGRQTGQTSQGTYAVAVGYVAGSTGQEYSAVAIGTNAGQTSQGSNSVAVGHAAGNAGQGSNSVAMGYLASSTGQEDYATAVGYSAGYQNQGASAVAVGQQAGKTSQKPSAIAIGAAAGQNTQQSYAIAIGYVAGQSSQSTQAIAIGDSAGQCKQGIRATAVGYNSGKTSQGVDATAIGRLAGCSGQGVDSVAVGQRAGQIDQADSSVAVGSEAGQSDQGTFSTAVGDRAAQFRQGAQAVAVGRLAGATDQGTYAVAVGDQAGSSNQGLFGVAIGYAAGYEDQGSAAIAIGRDASRNNQSANSICLNATGATLNNNAGATFQVKPVSAGVGNADLRYSTGNGLITYNTSDDRVKDNEVFIINAIRTLKKLKPQTYDKRTSLDSTDVIKGHEAGLMAQDIWYDAPELRHLVVLSETANPTLEKPTSNTNDPQDDPDYSTWGSGMSTIDYTQLITYLIKAVQEIVTELPRSKTTVSNTWGQNISGLVVSANENVHKTNTTPIVALSNVNMDKAWYGVVSDKITDTNDYDTLIDTKGDTQIWVTDIGGPLESGDLLTTSNVSPGFTQKQSDDIVRNYTVAKMTQDCDFTEPVQRAIRVPRQELSNVTYYIAQNETIITKSDYDQIGKEGGKTTETVTEYRKNEGDEFGIAQEKYDTLEPSEQEEYTGYEKIVYYRVENYETKYPRVSHPNIEIRQELVDVLDANGQIVWEDTANTVPAYTLVDHGTYKAALVSCKLI